VADFTILFHRYEIQNCFLVLQALFSQETSFPDKIPHRFEPSVVYSEVLAISNCTETCLPIPTLFKGERVLELASQLLVITKVVDRGLVGEIKGTISLQSCFFK
jgi:hypothetical protein